MEEIRHSQPAVHDSAVNESFLGNLVCGLEYVQKFTAAYAIFHLFDLELYRELLVGPASVDDLAQRLYLKPGMLEGFLEYCRIEGLVEKEEDGFKLSSFARTLAPYRGWFEFFIGGLWHNLSRNGLCPASGGPGARPGLCLRERWKLRDQPL